MVNYRVNQRSNGLLFVAPLLLVLLVMADNDKIYLSAKSMDEKTFLNQKCWPFLFLHPEHHHLSNTCHKNKPNDLYFYILHQN